MDIDFPFPARFSKALPTAMLVLEWVKKFPIVKSDGPSGLDFKRTATEILSCWLVKSYCQEKYWQCQVKFDLLNLEIKVRIRAPTPLLAEQLSTDNQSGLGEG